MSDESLFKTHSELRPLKKCLVFLVYIQLGPWFPIFFMFTPNLGEDEPILTSIFFRWVGKKPPTSQVYEAQFVS